MMSQGDYKKCLPLTEATYYIMLTLSEPLHGYAVMQDACFMVLFFELHQRWRLRPRWLMRYPPSLLFGTYLL